MKNADEYDVVQRLDGGKIAFAFCDDGQGHAFILKADDRAEDLPGCGTKIAVVRPMADDDYVCESCTVASEAWARGGQFKVLS